MLLYFEYYVKVRVFHDVNFNKKTMDLSMDPHPLQTFESVEGGQILWSNLLFDVETFPNPGQM